VIETGMSLLSDSEAVDHEWRRIIVQYGVSGVQVDDARLVAAMRVHGVTHILTLNVEDFSRYSGIALAHPSSV
jgi:predicted nucleic acid-binding protein